MMAHAQCVGIRKRQAQFTLDLPVILDDAVVLAADVLGGSLNSRKKAGDGVFEGLVEHGHSPCGRCLLGGAIRYYGKIIRSGKARPA